MVERQLRRRGITEQHILEAFLAVPREAFVGPEYAHLAYGDHPLPIEAGQTISQPYIVALMIQAAASAWRHGARGRRRLGLCGRGDQPHRRQGGRHRAPARAGRRSRASGCARLGYDNVEIVEGDGTRGWPDGAPYDAILAAASGSHVPRPLVEQLAPGGRLVMPIGDPGWVQELVKVTKQDDGILSQRESRRRCASCR